MKLAADLAGVTIRRPADPPTDLRAAVGASNHSGARGSLEEGEAAVLAPFAGIGRRVGRVAPRPLRPGDEARPTNSRPQVGIRLGGGCHRRVTRLYPPLARKRDRDRRGQWPQGSCFLRSVSLVSALQSTR